MSDHLRSKFFWAASVLMGTALVFVNVGERLVAGAWAWDLLWKVLLTYVLSFVMVAYLGFADGEN